MCSFLRKRTKKAFNPLRGNRRIDCADLARFRANRSERNFIYHPAGHGVSFQTESPRDSIAPCVIPDGDCAEILSRLVSFWREHTRPIESPKGHKGSSRMTPYGVRGDAIESRLTFILMTRGIFAIYKPTRHPRGSCAQDSSLRSRMTTKVVGRKRPKDLAWRTNKN